VPPKPARRTGFRSSLLPILRLLDLTRHPLRYVLIAIILVVAVGTFGVLFFLAKPGSVGDLREDYVTREAYTFRRLELGGMYATAVFDNGGAIIPVYGSGHQVTAVVVTGQGTLTCKAPRSNAGELATLLGDPKATTLTDNIDGCYLPLSYQELESIKETCSAEISHAYGIHLPEAENILRDVRRNPNLVMVFGQTRQFTEGAPVSAYFRGERFGGVTVLEGSTVSISVSLPEPGRVSFASEYPFRSVFSPMTVQTPLFSGAILGFGVVSFLLVALTYVLTIDLIHPRPQPRWARGHFPHPSSWDWAFVGAVLLGEMVVRLMVNVAQVRSEAVVLYQIVALLGMVYWVEYVGMDLPTYFGVTRHNLSRVLFVAASLGVLATIGGAVSFPSGVRNVRFVAAVAQMIWSFGFIGLIRAFYYYGFLQTTFERHFGRWWGWLGSAGVMALIYFLPSFIPAPGNPVTWPTSIVGGLVTLSLTFAVIGFLFHRTRSAWGAAVVLGLLDFLPKVLTF
jgi:hypothetical protein